MIRVAVGRQAVLRRMGSAAAHWMTRARLFTSEDEQAGRHIRRDNIWSEVKADLVALQHAKCAYCERRLGSAGVEWTVDHFRPKGAVRRRDALPAGACDVGGASAVGYYRLAYELENLLAACLPCNNAHKSDFFPTAQGRRLGSADPTELAGERPYLISPASQQDTDPEQAIGWRGPVPTPAGDGFTRQRALVTIDVLGLASREELIRERVLVLIGVWLAHSCGDSEVLDLLCDPTNQHAGCARRFRRLCQEQPAAAQAEYALLRRLVQAPG